MDARPINPFITGGPVPAAKFIGRREQVQTILGQLAHPESRGSSAISGERRIGRTSLLHYITSPEAAMRYNLPLGQFIFVSVDSQTLDVHMNSLGLQTFDEDVFWRYIAQFLVHFTQHASPLTQLVSRIRGFERLTKALRRFVGPRKQDKIGIFDLFELSEQTAADGKLIVLLLDEFEWIINNTDPQRPSLLHTLRSLINLPINKRGFALITSSEEPLRVLCKDFEFSGSPFPNSLVPVPLRPFSTDEADELIDEYLKGTGVAFSDEDKDFAYDLSEGHPYWLQRACFEMFNRHREHPGVLPDADRRAIASAIRAERVAVKEVEAAIEGRPRPERIHPLREPAKSEEEIQLKSELSEKKQREKTVWRTWAVSLILVLSASIVTWIGLLLSNDFLVQLSLVLWAALVGFIIAALVRVDSESGG